MKRSTSPMDSRAPVATCCSASEPPRGGSDSVARTISASTRPGQPHRHERHAPAVVLADPAAEQRAERAADRNAERVHRERGRAARGREHVGDQRVRGRAAAGLAHAHADARRDELSEAGREARQRGHPAPHEHGQRDDRASRSGVGPARDRNARERVEERERDPGEEAERRVGERDLLADVLGEDREDLPVHEVEHVHDQQEPERVAAVVVGQQPGTRRRGSLGDRCARAFNRHLPAMLSERAGPSQPFAVSW